MTDRIRMNPDGTYSDADTGLPIPADDPRAITMEEQWDELARALGRAMADLEFARINRAVTERSKKS